MAPSREGARSPDRVAERLRGLWEREGWTRPGDRVVVACSGGLDSLSLLHLLRFPLADLGLEIEVAHFDHAMRTDSGRDADWLRGLSAAWGLFFHRERAGEPPVDEAGARRLRYGFLDRVRRECGARWVLTAHQADDQVETLLFRILRGTGVRGLGGIPVTREPGILRPLLAFRREELERYARRRHLRPRVDPTNISLGHSRNRIRNTLLPLLEAVHPGARPAVLRLARNASRTTAALDALLEPVAEEAVTSRDESGIELDRDRLLSLEPAVQGALLLRMARELGISLDEAGTADALEFIKSGPSGGRRNLPGSVLLSRDFGRIRLRRREAEGRGDRETGREGDSAPLSILSPEPGEAEVRVAGVRLRVRWGREGVSGDRVERFDRDALAFPLQVRGWEAGDRTRTAGGGRKLKKLFGELRIPREIRHRIPLLVDGRGEVIWIPGWHRAPVAQVRPDGEAWLFGVDDVEHE